MSENDKKINPQGAENLPDDQLDSVAGGFAVPAMPATAPAAPAMHDNAGNGKMTASNPMARDDG